ncbi:MAG TPA: NAD(P)-binding protein [Ideonella sp.]|nr:NAD(P)-binding protein [Ideonella sp.]
MKRQEPSAQQRTLHRSHRGVFVLLRRVRTPLVLLIVAYAVAVLGFTLVPGSTPAGEPWRMSLFHAFYFVSFLGTTIGLGEIPYPFSDSQRLWGLLSIYSTVIAWLYAIGAIFSALQDPLFRRILHENRAAAGVARMHEPFYLLCGYDDSGTLVARELTEGGARLVVVDREMERVDAVEVDDLSLSVPALQADALDPRALMTAGIHHPRCVGVIALTGDDMVNIQIALAARLLNPDSTIICAARWHEKQADMAAVGADHIINPFDTFAERMVLALQAPSLHVIYEALTTQSSNAMNEPRPLPLGRWIVCGYGRFGRTVHRHLERVGIAVTVIEEHPSSEAPDGTITLPPTDPAAWRAAEIDGAGGVVVCGNSDTENLTATLIARKLNPEVFIAARQNERRNTPMFRFAPADLNVLSGYVVAAEVLRIIRAPQLSYFMRLARQQDEAWAHELLLAMREHVGDETVESWSVHLSPAEAPAVVAALRAGRSIRIGDLMCAPDNRERRLRGVPLLLQRGGSSANGANAKVLRPADDEPLAEDDRLLLCGRSRAISRMRWTIRDDTVLAYVLDGIASNRRVPWPELGRGGRVA